MCTGRGSNQGPPGRRISDQGVPGSNPGRCPTWTDCDEAGDYVVPNVLSPRDLVFRPDNKDETVTHTVY